MTPSTTVERPPKPISASERQALEKLLAEDFSLLSDDIRHMAEEAEGTALAEVHKEHKRQTDAARRAEDKLLDQIRKLADDGYTVHAGDPNRYGAMQVSRSTDTVRNTVKLTVVWDGLEKAERTAKAEVHKELQAALRIINRKHHAAKRELLKATISEDALKLLEQLPDATEVLADVAKELNAPLKRLSA
jgi:hypothetical protein